MLICDFTGKKLRACRKLSRYAHEGDVENAEQVLLQLKDAGLPPGPKAYHGLLFAYIRAQNPADALEVAKRTAAEGNASITHCFCM